MMHRTLEIGHIAYIKDVFTEQTTFISTEAIPARDDPSAGFHVFRTAGLPSLLRMLKDESFDAVVVHAQTNLPVNLQGLVRTLFSRRTVRGYFPVVRSMGSLLPAFAEAAAPVAMVDLEDHTVIRRHNLPLLRASCLAFKRELPADRWRLLSGRTGSPHPSPRFRRTSSIGPHLDKVRPVSLGLKRGEPFGAAYGAFDRPRPKQTDIFFAGLVEGNSTVRRTGLQEVLALRDAGFAVDIPDRRLTPDEFLERCARAWIVWSPEGLGWDCFRHYEAPVAWSVPLINAPSIERHAPLLEGVHAFYYDTVPGGLTNAFRAAIADKGRLLAMAEAARRHVLTHHTPAAIAAYIVGTTVEQARALRTSP